MRSSSLPWAFGIMVVAAALGCEDASQVTGPKSANLDITLSLSGTSISKVIAEVTAPDIDPPVVDTLEIQGDTARGTLTVPAGSDRTITLRAFDASKIETHRGSATVSIEPGSNQNIQITLEALTGQVTVTGIIAYGAVLPRSVVAAFATPPGGSTLFRFQVHQL